MGKARSRAVGVGEEVLGWIAKYAREKLAAASVQEKGGEEKT